MTFKDAQSYLINYCNLVLESKQIERTQNRFVCPFCNSGNKTNSTASFTIVKKSSNTHYKCFSCGAHGDVFDLIQSTQHCDLPQAIQSFENLFDVKIDKRTLPKSNGIKPINTNIQTLYNERKQKNNFNDIDLKITTDFNKIYIEQLPQSKWALKHLHDRALNDEIIKQYQIGFDAKSNRIMLPYPKSYSILKYNPMMQPKYNATGTKPNDIYNIDILKQGNPTFVCEGIFDALSILQCGYNAIAILGTGNANNLIDYVLKNKIDTPLIIMFDTDAEQKQNELCQQLYESKKIAISCNTPLMMQRQYKNVKDPNDCLKANEKTFKKLLQHNFEFALKKQSNIKVQFAIKK